MTLVYARKLTPQGIGELQELCEKVRREFRKGESIHNIDRWSLPEAKTYLDDSELSDDLPRELKFSLDDKRDFVNQYDLAGYLFRCLPQPIRENPWLGEVEGVWEWLAILYAEQFSSADDEEDEGERRIKRPLFGKEDIYWIRDQRDDFVHYTFGGFALYAAVVKNRSLCQKLLSSRLGVYPKACRELYKRRRIISCPSIVELAVKLYWDEATKTWKKACAHNEPGGVRRLTEVLGQFEYTYDLYSLTADELWEMLPREFDRFKESSALQV